MNLVIPDLEQARVLVAGDVMLDQYWYGNSERISPEAPVPIVHVGDSEDRVGGAGNVAMNIAALGGRTAVLAYVGADEAGQRLAGLLAAHGCEAALEELAGHATVTKLRVLSQHQQLIRLDFEQTSAALPSRPLVDRLETLLPDAGVVVLSDYAKGTLADPQPLIRMARARGIPVLVDPKRPDFSAYRGASLLTPNLKEFFHAVGECADEAELEARGQRLIADLELEALLITRGEDGMTLLRCAAPALHLPTHAREVYDVTGAGDTVIATFTLARAVGAEWLEAAVLASIAGSGLEGGEKASLEQEFGWFLETIGTFRFAVTKPYYLNPEKKAAHSGGLFSVTINPYTCKGCMECVEACNDAALVATPQTAESVARLRRDWAFWLDLPTTRPEYIRIDDLDECIGALETLLLDKHNFGAMVCGDGACVGCGEKTALRLFTATVTALM